MKKDQKQNNFRNANDNGKYQKNKIILCKVYDFVFAEAKAKSPTERKSDRRYKDAIKQNMHREIESNRYKRSRHTIDAKKYRQTASECISPKNDNQGSYDKPDRMNPCCQQQQQNQRMTQKTVQKYQKNAAVAKTNAFNKAFATVQMIIIYGGRFYKDDSEYRSRNEKNAKDKQDDFFFKDTPETFFYRQKMLHILLYEASSDKINQISLLFNYLSYSRLQSRNRASDRLKKHG